MTAKKPTKEIQEVMDGIGKSGILPSGYSYNPRKRPPVFKTGEDESEVQDEDESPATDGAESQATDSEG
jgi:hypothetical protein